MLGGGHIPLDAPAGRLAMGERQLVEIARMLTRDARVLILDEPTATLSDVEIERIFAALRRSRREGKSVIYITHRLGEVFRICDTRDVLRNGELVGTLGRPGHRPQGADRDDARAAVRGNVSAAPRPPRRAAALVVEDLCVPAASNASASACPKGKIVCIAGQVGSGAVEVVNALAGLVHDASGDVHVEGKLARAWFNRARAQEQRHVHLGRSRRGGHLPPAARATTT